MRLGSARHGPSAPDTCHAGKYEVFTSTGTPTRSTWKLMLSVVVWMRDTCTAGSGAPERAIAVGADRRGHEAGPPATSSRGHAAGESYQRWATGSHEFC